MCNKGCLQGKFCESLRSSPSVLRAGLPGCPRARHIAKAHSSEEPLMDPSVINIATIFVVLFGWERWLAIAIGGAIVLVYSTVGGMWSITLADQVQFIIKTVGIFALMLPFALNSAGGMDGIRARVDASFFQIDGIG